MARCSRDTFGVTFGRSLSNQSSPKNRVTNCGSGLTGGGGGGGVGVGSRGSGGGVFGLTLGGGGRETSFCTGRLGLSGSLIATLASSCSGVLGGGCDQTER